MNRKPIYNSDRTTRIVSAPSGRGYIFQRLSGGEGSRTFDPWFDDSPIMEFSKAHARLTATDVKKKEA